MTEIGRLISKSKCEAKDKARGKTVDNKLIDETLTDHDHHLGLQHDLKMIMKRRRALALLGSAGLLAACAGSSSSPVVVDSDTDTDTGSGSGSGGGSGTGTTTTDTCVSYAAETNGPFPADGSNTANGQIANVLIDSGVVKSDMTTSFAGLSGTATGVAMEITITLQNFNNDCAALEGYAVYLWHCDSTGEYSVYNITDQNYLRAVGVTDENGQVTFQTIFPGCYPGRWPHFHFEVYASLADATHYDNRILVSQFAVPADEASYVYSVRTDYGDSRLNFVNLTLGTDNVFGDNTDEQIEAQTLTMSGNDTEGYTSTVTVGIAL